MGIQIEVSDILLSRSKAAYRVMHEAGVHGDKYDAMEGLLILLIATAFTAKQYGIPNKEFQRAVSGTYAMITKAQKFCGDKAGVSEMVVEMGLN
jgi:hypothetical protein